MNVWLTCVILFLLLLIHQITGYTSYSYFVVFSPLFCMVMDSSEKPRRGIMKSPVPHYKDDADSMAEKEKHINTFKVTGNILDCETFKVDDKFANFMAQTAEKIWHFGDLEFNLRKVEFVRNNAHKIHKFRGELEYLIFQIGMGNEEFKKAVVSYIKKLGYDGVKYESDTDFENNGESHNYVIYNKNIIHPANNLIESKDMRSQSEIEEDRQHRIVHIKNELTKLNIHFNGDFVSLYHGTSPKNYKLILKSNRLNSGTWLSQDMAVARRYALMHLKRGEPIVDLCLVYIGSLYFNGYFSTTEDLYFKNGRWQPKDLRL